MKKINKFLLSILIIFVIMTVFFSIFNYTGNYSLNPFAIVFGTIILIMFLIGVKKIVSKVNEKTAIIIAIILSVLFFICLAIIGNINTTTPKYDFQTIIEQVQKMIIDGTKSISFKYFSRYPHQTPITVIVYYFYQVGEMLFDGATREFSIVINSLLITITAFFTFLSVKKLTDHKIGLTTLIFIVLNPCFYIFVSYFYTDTVCMPFAAISIYLYVLSRTQENRKKEMLLKLLSCIILAIGFKIRAVLVILLIAYIIDILIKISKPIIKRTLLSIVILVCGFIIGLIACKGIESTFEINYNDSLTYPITHWIMMGTNTNSNGKFSLSDYIYTRDLEGNKAEKNLEKIGDRLGKIYSEGILPFIAEKIKLNWSCGTYRYISDFKNVDRMNPLYQYTYGNKNIVFLYSCQIFKVTLMTICLIAIIKQIINPNDSFNFIFIAILGAYGFYLIWEVLAKYSLTFLPWIVLTFGVGLKTIEDSTDDSYYCKGVFKYLSKLIIICTVLFLVANFGKYCINKDTYWDSSAVQYYNQNNLIEKISDKTIEQTFTAYSSFNCIDIKFNTSKSKDNTKYVFKLKDENGKTYTSQLFYSKDVTPGDFKKFYFDEVIPEYMYQKFIIEIRSLDATDENSLGLYNYYIETFDTFPEGNLFINGQEYNADLTFKVQKEVQRTYMSIHEYLVISILILCLELFAFKNEIFIKKKTNEKNIKIDNNTK